MAVAAARLCECEVAGAGVSQQVTCGVVGRRAAGVRCDAAVDDT